MKKYGFVYIWLDSKHKRYYVGSHWGTENDAYVCSSSWMKKAYKNRPEDFKRKIITRIYSSKQDLLNEENRWLAMIKPEELKERYYNLRIHAFGHWSVDQDLSLTVGQKISSSPDRAKNISAALKGKSLTENHKHKLRSVNIGKKYSDEINIKKGINNRDYSDVDFKEKMKNAATNRSIKTRMKISENMKRLHTEGKIGMRGKKHSPETIEKMKMAAKNRELNKKHSSI
jgi:hypothetical protein